MKAFLKVDNQVLSRLLFGNNEVNIVAVAMYETGPDGFIEFNLDCNPDLIEHKENASISVDYRTEPIVVAKTIRVHK